MRQGARRPGTYRFLEPHNPRPETNDPNRKEMQMDFKQHKTIEGVARRDFDIEVAGENVPCAIWAPEANTPATVLICMGHGASQHKKIVGIRERAVSYAQRFGWATLAIDAPGHGDRLSRAEAETLANATRADVTVEAGSGFWNAERIQWFSEHTRGAVPEWKRALDTALQLDFVADDAAVGYWGLSMGAAIGISFVASDPRIRCAVFGLFGMIPGMSNREAAGQIEIPIQFVLQWDDPVAPRDAGLALFDAFGSKEKSMHIHPGGHLEIPQFERESWPAFYARHLGAPA